jgi:outer membrane lipoprotein LolB
MPKSECCLPFLRLAGCLLLAVLLSACAALPGAPGEQPGRDALTDFSLEGRFSLRYEDKNYSGRLSWRHRGSDDELLLSSPFGQGLAEIVSAPQGARLTLSDGKSYAAADAEMLTRQVLGYPLPLTRLTDWVRGRAAGGEVERDAFGRVLHLRHEAWKIDYDYADDDRQAPPSRIFAESAGGIELRLRIDQWRCLMPGE